MSQLNYLSPVSADESKPALRKILNKVFSNGNQVSDTCGEVHPVPSLAVAMIEIFLRDMERMDALAPVVPCQYVRHHVMIHTKALDCIDAVHLMRQCGKTYQASFHILDIAKHIPYNENVQQNALEALRGCSYEGMSVELVGLVLDEICLIASRFQTNHDLQHLALATLVRAARSIETSTESLDKLLLQNRTLCTMLQIFETVPQRLVGKIGLFLRDLSVLYFEAYELVVQLSSLFNEQGQLLASQENAEKESFLSSVLFFCQQILIETSNTLSSISGAMESFKNQPNFSRCDEMPMPAATTLVAFDILAFTSTLERTLCSLGSTPATTKLSIYPLFLICSKSAVSQIELTQNKMFLKRCSDSLVELASTNYSDSAKVGFFKDSVTDDNEILRAIQKTME